MAENYLKTYIESLFAEITFLNANLNVLDTFVEERGKELHRNFPFTDYQLYSMGSTYRDLTQLEGGNNLYLTNVHYRLATSNLNGEIERLKSYTSCLTITHSFEVFESFLKNVLSILIQNNQSLVSDLKLECEADFDAIRRNLFRIQGESNKGFIKVLRKISPFFKAHEQNNIWQRNMSHWFEIIAKVRNLVVHSRLILNQEFKEYILETHRLKLFRLHFTISEENGLTKLALTPYQANAIIDHLYEYAHLIYKSLSIDFGLDLDSNFNHLEL